MEKIEINKPHYTSDELTERIHTIAENSGYSLQTQIEKIGEVIDYAITLHKKDLDAIFGSPLDDIVSKIDLDFFLPIMSEVDKFQKDVSGITNENFHKLNILKVGFITIFFTEGKKLQQNTPHPKPLPHEITNAVLALSSDIEGFYSFIKEFVEVLKRSSNIEMFKRITPENVYSFYQYWKIMQMFNNARDPKNISSKKSNKEILEAIRILRESLLQNSRVNIYGKYLKMRRSPSHHNAQNQPRAHNRSNIISFPIQ